ncbi:MAG: ABC transporter permease [Anaerolineae bacterium]|nr:ABC transporter permease [Anaerolineae bacterium]
MKKILNIAWKDLIIIFRDPGALLLMLGAPFLLTLGMGLVTGAFSDSDSSTGLSDIPVLIVNQDSGELGSALTDLFFQDDLATLLKPDTATTPEIARQQVDDNKIAAVVIIPAGFTDSIIPNQETAQRADTVAIEVYKNPARPISASVVQNIVDDFVTQVNTRAIGIGITMQQLAMNGRLTPATQSSIQNQQASITFTPLIEIQQETAVDPTDDATNPLAYFAPGMAVAFLMYTVSLGGRSILAERDEGTLARLLASPTSATQVMGGKVSGIFLTGAAQVSVLIIASSLLFQLRWGNPTAVALLIAATAAAATGWGLLIAAISDRPSQVSSYGTALMLLFGIMGGSFVQLPFDGPFAWLSKITPNAWAIEGFDMLGTGGSLADILPVLLALTLMAATLFIISVTLFRRRSNNFV